MFAYGWLFGLIIAGASSVAGVPRNSPPLPLMPPVEIPEGGRPVVSRNGTILPPYNYTYYFDQLIDHNNPQAGTFKQRYWVNKRHYKKGGPVIVLDGGETSGEDRLPFLDTGIVDILTKATSGLGVVLEHRYYGKSTIQSGSSIY